MDYRILENRVKSGDTLVDTPLLLSAEQDLGWLSAHNAGVTEHHLGELSRLAELGSLRMDLPENKEKQADTMRAREQFYENVGVPERVLKERRKYRANLVSPDTFIDSQRTMYGFGLDVAAILKKEPLAMAYTSESVTEKVTNLINLGLDAVKVINAMPTLLGLNLERIREKVANLASLGLNSVRVINLQPSTLNRPVDTIRRNTQNMKELGLDSIKVINALPAAISYSPEHVRKRVRQVNRYARVLGWEDDVTDLINYQPGILSYDSKRLATLARIAASDIPAEQVSKSLITQSLIAPLDSFIVALGESSQGFSGAAGLVKAARANKQAKSERQERALKYAPQLGRTGMAYLRYRNKD